jgi:hypothetical protein
VLAAADGASNPAIGRALGVCDYTVRKRRRRFCRQGLDGLRDRPAPDGPAGSRRRWCRSKGPACELPDNRDMPLAKWSCPDQAVDAARRGGGATV